MHLIDHRSFVCCIVLIFSIPSMAAAFDEPPDWSTHSPLTSAADAEHLCSWLYCPRSATYELALEKEYWRHVQWMDTIGMLDWLEKTARYSTHWSHSRSFMKQKGRLWMLMAGGHTMLFQQYDLHSLVPAINNLLERDVKNLFENIQQAIGEIPALYHLAQSIQWAIRANQQIPEHLAARTFLLGSGSFVQMALPMIAGLAGKPAAMNTMYGPSCSGFPTWMQQQLEPICYANGLMGPTVDAFATCTDFVSCQQVGSGTEGLVAGVLTMMLTHDPDLLDLALQMLGDGPADREVASCHGFWCGFINPNVTEATFPEATSIAPFKKIVMQLAIAEAYGKSGDLQKMEVALEEAQAEADRLRWPFDDFLDDVVTALHGGNPGAGIPDILDAWSNPDPTLDFIGEIQLPLPVSLGSRSCRACHFGGVMNEEVAY